MSDENANEPNNTPWFARQVGEERGTDYSRVSFPAWLRNAPAGPSDDQAAGAGAPEADVAAAAPHNDAPAADAPELNSPAGESAEEAQAPAIEDVAERGEEAVSPVEAEAFVAETAEVDAPETAEVAADFEAAQDRTAQDEEAAAEEALQADPEAEPAGDLVPEAAEPTQAVEASTEVSPEVAPQASDQNAAEAEAVAAEAVGGAAVEVPDVDAAAEEAVVEEDPAVSLPAWAAMAPEESSPEAKLVEESAELPEPAPVGAEAVAEENPAQADGAEADSAEVGAEPAPTPHSPVPSRRSLRQGTWLDALEEENREAQAAEEAARAALELEEAKAAELAAPELATPDQAAPDLADVAPLPPTEFDSASHTEDASPAAQPAGPPTADAEEVDSTAVRRYSLLAAVGATATASRLEEETFPAEPAGRAAPAEQVLGLKETAVEEVAAVEAAKPAAEPDWREAIHTGRHEAIEAPAEESVPSWNPLSEEDVAHSPVAPQEAAKPAEDSVLEGASFQPTPLSRASAHWWSLLFTLLLVPVAWFLVTDAAAQLASVQSINAGSTLHLTTPGVWPLTELILGAIAGSLAVFVARWSSVGACVVGTLFTVVGGLLAFVPHQVNMWVGALFTDLLGYNAATQRFVLAFLGDGVSGRILLGGLFLIFVGVVSHGARRQGRREQANHDVLGQRKAKRRRAKH